jgi:hypothetical protein
LLKRRLGGWVSLAGAGALAASTGFRRARSRGGEEEKE